MQMCFLFVGVDIFMHWGGGGGEGLCWFIIFFFKGCAPYYVVLTVSIQFLYFYYREIIFVKD